MTTWERLNFIDDVSRLKKFTIYQKWVPPEKEQTLFGYPQKNKKKKKMGQILLDISSQIRILVSKAEKKLGDLFGMVQYRG